MTDTWTWATVTQATPLRIKVDGDTTALDATTDNLVGSLAVDDRVRVHLHSDGIIVTGVQGGGNRSNPNLLINSNFLVNQREAVSGATVATGGYFLDRWRNHTTEPATSLITWADSGGVRTLTLGGGGATVTVSQTLEQSSFPAGTYTLSWEGTAAGTLYGGGASSSFTTSPATITTDGSENMIARFGGNGATLRNVKIEQGSVATPYQPPTYDDNLRACMRYYQRFGGMSPYQRFGIGVAASTTLARVQAPLAVPMRRIAPTLTYYAVALGGGGAVSEVSLSSVSYGEIINELLVTASGLTASSPYELRADNSLSAFVAFDAEL